MKRRARNIKVGKGNERKGRKGKWEWNTKIKEERTGKGREGNMALLVICSVPAIVTDAVTHITPFLSTPF